MVTGLADFFLFQASYAALALPPPSREPQTRHAGVDDNPVTLLNAAHRLRDLVQPRLPWRARVDRPAARTPDNIGDAGAAAGAHVTSGRGMHHQPHGIIERG